MIKLTITISDLDDGATTVERDVVGLDASPTESYAATMIGDAITQALQPNDLIEGSISAEGPGAMDAVMRMHKLRGGG